MNLAGASCIGFTYACNGSYLETVGGDSGRMLISLFQMTQ